MDIATLGVRITTDGIGKVTSELDALAAKGEAVAKKVGDAGTVGANRFSQAFTQSSAAAQASAKAQESAGERVQQTYKRVTDSSRAMTLAQIEAIAMNEKMSVGALEAAEHAEHHALALGRVAKSFENFAVEATGANEQVALLAASMGHLEFGEVAVVGALGAIFVGLKVWEAWREAEEKAKEEQDKLTESLLKWYEVQKQGAAGEFPKQIEAMTKKVKELHEEMDKLMAGKFFADTKVIGEGGSKAAAWIRIFSAGDINAMAHQFSIEFAKGASTVAKAITDGGEAIEAAKVEAAKRVSEDAIKKQLDRLQDIQAQSEAALVPVDALADGLLKQLDSMRKVNQENNVALTKADQQRAAAGKEGEALAYLQSAQTAELETLQARHDLSGVALSDRLAAIDAEKKQRDETIRLTQAHTDAIDAQKALNDQGERAQQIGEHNVAITKATEDTQKFTTANQKLADVLQHDVTRALGQFAQGGITSFRSFFHEAEQLSNQFTDHYANAIREQQTLEAEANKKGETDLARSIVAKIAQLQKLRDAAAGVSAAIAGATIGYSIGQSTGNSTTGQVGGAIAGAATGFEIAGPWGAVIGGLAGAASGLLGAAKAQKEAADAQHAAAISARVSLLEMNVEAGTSSQRALDVIKTKIAADALSDAIDAALPGLRNQIEREKELAQVRADELIILTKINNAASEQNRREIEDLQVRQLVALGQTDEANALRQLLEVQDAETAKKGEAYIAALKLTQALENEAAATAKANAAFFQQADADWAAVQAQRQQANQAAQEAAQKVEDQRRAFNDAIAKQTKAATDLLRAQLKGAQDQLRFAQQAESATSRALDSLTKWRDAMLLGPQSALSPIEQLNEAKRQAETLFRQAQLGDKDAAANFGGAASTYLQQAQSYSASGPGFAAAFDAVRSMTGSLVTQYGVQESIDQQMLDSSQAQVDLLQQQLDAIQAASDAISNAVGGASAAQIAALGAALSGAGGGAGAAGGSGAGSGAGGMSGTGGVSGLGGHKYADTWVHQTFFDPTGQVHMSWEQWLARVTSQDGSDRSLAWLDTPQNHAQWLAAYGYANGGDFGGGLRLVGERGPELEITGPSRISSHGSTQDMLANAMGASRELRDEIKAMRAELRAVGQAGAKETIARLDALLEKTDENTRATRLGLEQVKTAVG